MPPNDPNPYQAPQSPTEEMAVEEVATNQLQRPSVYDWFIAIVLGLTAVIVVFSTTCIGSAIVLATAVSWSTSFSVSGPSFFWMMVVCMVLALLAGVCVMVRYIVRVQKNL